MPSCVLRACTVEDNAVVQANSVLCEGSLVESGAVVGAGSVVPPGRRVPAGQLWAGNPVEYVRDITPGEVEEMAAQVKRDLGHLQDHESNCYPVGNPANKSCQPNSKMRGDRAQQDSRPLRQQWDRDPRATC